jgi:hypothetical protein
MNPTQQACQKALFVIAGCIVAALALAPGAKANLEFSSVSATLTETDGSLSRQAGAHPDLTFEFSLPAGPPEAVRDVELELPPGLLGNAEVLPTCSIQQMVNGWYGAPNCPVSSQIGYIDLELSNAVNPVAVYNMEPGPEAPALFAFQYLGAIATISAGVRPEDYGVSSGSLEIPQILNVLAAKLTIWGVPADPSHDALRQGRGFGWIEPGFPHSSEAPMVAFLRNPTSCSAPAPFTVRGDSWEQPGIFDTRLLAEDSNGTPFVFNGCENLKFAPKLTAQPTAAAAATPAGLEVEFEVPQNETPDGLSTSDVRSTVLTFPTGMTVSPSSAQGLGSCGIAEIGLGTNDPPSCPPSSKLGTVKIETPLLGEELEGDVILAKQKDNPFGSLLAMYMAVKGPGFYLKLPGRVDLDPQTGQVTASFSDTPQLPFSKLSLELKSGPRAPLTLPSACGTYAIQTEITPWSGTDPVRGQSTFKVDQACDGGGFDPKLRAGTADPSAGESSPFTLQVLREDGEQNLSRIDTTLPEGLLAKLAGVPLCGDAAATSGDCPAASRIGKTIVGAGAGSNPLYLPEAGKAPTAIYLAGPYKGAPYSLVVKVPAQAGPFDLGTVAVRSGIRLDPVTTRASVASDPLPQILEGIPIAYRDVRVEIDRDGFMRNPTGCEPMKVESTLFGSGGATASPSARFQAVNCERLAFKPKLALKFSGPTHRSAHPALKATLKMPKGGANIGKAVVTLPETEFLENAHIRTICTRVQYAADNCPKGSVYGYAKAWTPLLDKPLRGPVYLRSSNHTLPDLVASLDGQIHVDLAGRIDSPGGKIRNTFWAVPDAPVSKFVLTMQGGAKGLLVNNEELCQAKPRARAEFTGQNGKRSASRPLVKIDCGKHVRKR